ncbi:hypothetical protein OROMI_005267 [Orobanche minor]
MVTKSQRQSISSDLQSQSAAICSDSAAKLRLWSASPPSTPPPFSVQPIRSRQRQLHVPPSLRHATHRCCLRTRREWQ